MCVDPIFGFIPFRIYTTQKHAQILHYSWKQSMSMYMHVHKMGCEGCVGVVWRESYLYYFLSSVKENTKSKMQVDY
jgi:hypothetical protein